MNIAHRKSTWPPVAGEYKNSIVLYDDAWNDFSYKTMFHAVFCDENGDVSRIGDVKIYHYNYDQARTENYGRPVSELLAPRIEQLSGKFCSLGQSLKYYQNLKKFLPYDFYEILKKLNDIAVFPKIREKYLMEHGVQTSLLRDSSAEKALYEAAGLLETDRLREKDMSFKYLARVPYALEPTELSFHFGRRESVPYRINILIGKNGTGKTQILTNLANSLSGISDTAENRASIFIGSRPPVDKVISISYSAFDTFRKRPDEDSPYKSNSYVYCGIQSEHGTLSLNELHQNFENALSVVKEKGRLEAWSAVMSELIEEEHVALLSRIMDGERSDIHFSSGQHILICTITEALANIEKESMLLFDEPELHLHPNAVANTMRMLYRLLEEFDSYAIFATHSPLIVQETPSVYIQILSRVNNVLTVRHPDLECFGENITGITNDIFDVRSTESNYKTVLRQLSEQMTYDEIMELFDGRLSFNAMIYLKNCCKAKE